MITKIKEFKGFFRTFPQIQKSAALGPHSGSELLPESSSSTRRAYAVPMDPEEDESVTESESEVEEDCDLAAFPGRWYLLGTGFDGVDLVG